MRRGTSPRTSVAYTNHTVMAEALERWPQSLFAQLAAAHRGRSSRRSTDRFCKSRWSDFCHGDRQRSAHMAIVWRRRGAAWRTSASRRRIAVNGVVRAPLRYPAQGRVPRRLRHACREKFTNVTNGIDHRRWLLPEQPRPDGAASTSCIGEAVSAPTRARLKELETLRGRRRRSAAAWPRSSASNKERLRAPASRKRRGRRARTRTPSSTCRSSACTSTSGSC